MSVRVSPKGNVPQRVRPRLRRRRKRSVWRKTIIPIIGAFLAVMFVVACINKVVRPFKLYSREYQATEELRRQYESCKRENVTLQRRIKYLKTQTGAAQAARELGWVKPGEITLVLPPEKGNTPQE